MILDARVHSHGVVNTTLNANDIDRVTNVVSNLMSLLLLSILLLYVCLCTSSTIILYELCVLRSTYLLPTPVCTWVFSYDRAASQFRVLSP